jgi:hypothetical protein
MFNTVATRLLPTPEGGGIRREEARVKDHPLKGVACQESLLAYESQLQRLRHEAS